MGGRPYRHRLTYDDYVNLIREKGPYAFGRKRPKYEILEPALREVQKEGKWTDLRPYDFKWTFGIWRKGTWRNYELGREMTKRIVLALHERTKRPFLNLFPSINSQHFRGYAINCYNTQGRTMLSRLYNDSPPGALMDLIKHDDEFSDYRDIRPYDFVVQRHVYGTPVGKALAREMTKRLIRQKMKNTGLTEMETIVSLIDRDFKKTPINRYGTICHGMLGKVYFDSPYVAVRDLVDNDEDFKSFRDLQRHDFKVGNNFWSSAEGRRTARNLVRITIKQYCILNGLQIDKALRRIRSLDFRRIAVNRYGTTARTPFDRIYRSSPYAAIRDLADHDKEFRAYKDYQRYDMYVSDHFWQSSQGRKAAREMTRKLIAVKMQRERKTLVEVAPTLTGRDFCKISINRYGTTCRHSYLEVYMQSCYRALQDLAAHEEEFSAIRDLQPYDLKVPGHFWHTSYGRRCARLMIKKAVLTIMEKRMISLAEAVASLTGEDIRKTTINRYHTTGTAPISKVYKGSPTAALLDLCASDAEFKQYQEVAMERLKKQVRAGKLRKGSRSLIEKRFGIDVRRLVKSDKRKPATDSMSRANP